MGMLDALAHEARGCRRCCGVASGSSVLGRGNGPVPASLMFVAEAPGYLGAVRSGVPLRGDRSGANFEAYCGAAGIDGATAFVTNAVLCHPPDAGGRNRAPRATEISACASYLGRQVELVEPLLVVALGRVALEALALVEPHALRFGANVGLVQPWSGRHLVSLYHPSGRTAGQRSTEEQRADYRAVAAWLAVRARMSPAVRRSV